MPVLHGEVDRHTRAVTWSVNGDSTTVEAGSSVRLPFEPHGELYKYRDALRAALRKLTPAPSHGLVATYLSPDSEFVDAENVLLYNVGAGSYSHLVAGGLFVSREPSADDLHHLRYPVAPIPVLPPGKRLASIESTVPVDLHSPGAWWSVLRSAITVAHPGIVTMGGSRST